MRVDFYQLAHDPVEQVLPAIAQKLLDDGQRLLVVDERETMRALLSRALWEWKPDSFLAHGVSGQDDDAVHPILLSDHTEAVNQARNIALTDGQWREDALSFDRTFYFFDESTIAAARDCWRALKGRDDVLPHFWRQEGRKWVQGP